MVSLANSENDLLIVESYFTYCLVCLCIVFGAMDFAAVFFYLISFLYFFASLGGWAYRKHAALRP